MKKKPPYKKRKYKNKKVTIDDITFDSGAEASYYMHLNMLKKAGEVESFDMQKKYVLQEKFKHPATGSTVRAITYTPDFVVTYADGSTVVIDVKGFETQMFKMKAKMFMYKYNLPLVLVKLSSNKKSFVHTNY